MDNKSYQNLKIELVPVNKIKPYKNNAKLHPSYQIDEIINSINLFGFKDPLALDKNFEIIEGHGRYLAAKKIGMEELPCMIFSDMTEAKKYLYSIVHNKLTMNTGFNENLLQQELEKISNDIDFEDFDFTSFGLEKFSLTKEAYSEIEKDVESLIDCTQERKDDQKNKKAVQVIKCPFCKKEWEK